MSSRIQDTTYFAVSLADDSEGKLCHLFLLFYYWRAAPSIKPYCMEPPFRIKKIERNGRIWYLYWLKKNTANYNIKRIYNSFQNNAHLWKLFLFQFLCTKFIQYILSGSGIKVAGILCFNYYVLCSNFRATLKYI